MTDDVAGGHLDWCGAVERGERRSGAESGDRARPGEDLASQWDADAVELGQGAPGGRDGRCDVLIGGGDASIQVADLGDQVGGQSSQGLLQRRPRVGAANVNVSTIVVAVGFAAGSRPRQPARPQTAEASRKLWKSCEGSSCTAKVSGLET